MKVKSESEVAQLCLTLGDPMICSLPGSSSMGFSRQEYWSECQIQNGRVAVRAGGGEHGLPVSNEDSFSSTRRKEFQGRMVTVEVQQCECT